MAKNGTTKNSTNDIGRRGKNRRTRDREAEATIRLDPLTCTVVNDAGEREKMQTVRLYVGFGQPDKQSTALTGQEPAQLIYRS